MSYCSYKLIADKPLINYRPQASYLASSVFLGTVLDLGYQNFTFLNNYLESFLANWSLQHDLIQSLEISWLFNEDLVNIDWAELGIATGVFLVIGILADIVMRNIRHSVNYAYDSSDFPRGVIKVDEWSEKIQNSEEVSERWFGEPTLKSTIAAVHDYCSEALISIEQLPQTYDRQAVDMQWAKSWFLILKALNELVGLYNVDEEGIFNSSRQKLIQYQEYQVFLRRFVSYCNQNHQEVSDKLLLKVEGQIRVLVLSYRQQIKDSKADLREDFEKVYQSFLSDLNDLLAKYVPKQNQE